MNTSPTHIETLTGLKKVIAKTLNSQPYEINRVTLSHALFNRLNSWQLSNKYPSLLAFRNGRTTNLVKINV